ncbi:hypothetical protein SAMN04489718_3412 [Actinopolyspora saharensis]|uniref:Uncharacterized protein n=1 Tax=Actinopolyspora saharensis TaxID=995062 RepID=A0A1H1G446_9ACTN|nr:hypothetical protein SAMN04489718_3412 [Actinopolyspora saharensis]
MPRRTRRLPTLFGRPLWIVAGIALGVLAPAVLSALPRVRGRSGVLPVFRLPVSGGGMPRVAAVGPVVTLVSHE